MMQFQKGTREEKRIFVDSFFEYFGIYCKKLGLRMKTSNSSQGSESIYAIISKGEREWTVRISAHQRKPNFWNKSKSKECDFNFIFGDELYDTLVKFTNYFVPPIKSSKKNRKKEAVP
jgi:hypothetical protein